MTYEEAIKELQYGIKCPEGQSDVVRVIWSGDIREAALDIAIEALERRIPIKSKIGFAKYYECPRCSRLLETIEPFNYCGYCGQRLDMSEVANE